MIETERLILRQWTEADRDPFAAMVADPEVMHDSAPFTRAEADARFDRYRAHIAEFGFGKRVAERRSDGGFLGYVGVANIFPELPIHPGLEIGWRLSRSAWSHGYATEAARASLRDIFERTAVAEVVSFTAPTNTRSLAVMRRLGLARDASRDFAYPDGKPAVLFVAARQAFQPV